ncbi:MAG: hypothetical protein HDR31_00360, partial [Mycoplasma sp.]|nr:hypothetical protein [Mycoplasma sp.]
EKENLLAKLISILKEDTKDFDDVLKIISVIDEKIKNFNELISENLEISKDISEGNVFNETSQISDRVDALSQYLKTVSENLYTLNFDYENIWMLDEIKNFGNLEFIHRKLNSLTDEIQSINNSSCNDSQIIKKLDQIKLDLLSIESDLKLIRISVDSNSESNIKEFNIKKSNFISNLIKENKILINNLLKEKENLVKNITEKAVIDNNISELQKNNLEILLEGKAGIIFEIIFKEIQKIQEQNISNFNTKLNELKNQLTNNLNSNNDTNCDPYAFVVDKKLLDKIENIENNIHSIFNQIDEKKNNFLNGLESKVGNNDLVEKIINKFDKEKESLAEIHQRKRNELKDLIINFKNKELESYRKKLNSLESEIKNLKESNSSNDKNFLDFENDIDQEQEKLSLLEDLIENLTLEINSFDEEKIAMFNEMENKINYLDDLNNPLKEGLIELESDNWNSDKFKKIVSKETQEIINSKFQGLKKDCDFNIQKIESTLKDLKNIHSQLSEIDKKLSDNTTLDERMGDLENLVFEPIKKADVENNNKITNYHLKLIDDNIKFYVDELEKKKIEIANFYRKVRNLTINREKKVEE